jgi:hypothetical protein
MGRKDIAGYLIERGARPNIFVLAMLAKTELVKYQLDLFPEQLYAKGAAWFYIASSCHTGR